MISSDEDVVDYLLEGLTILQNRGYDSAGIATIGDGLTCTKYASKGTTSDSLDMLQSECPTTHKSDHCGIAHTRWATHGGKTDRNAHPHCDYSSRIALVHNGTIQNCTELKNELRSLGIEFQSETDTEVIANLVGFYLDEIQAHPHKYEQTNGRPFDDVATALELALNRLDGSWGLAMVHHNAPNKIYVARHGSPLMIGLDSDNNRNFIASEHTAFAKYTRNYISLNEGEMAVVTANDISIEDAHSRIRKIENYDSRNFVTSPAPFPTWTEKEISEQPSAISAALQFGARLSYDDKVVLGGLSNNVHNLQNIRNLIITGCGTSLNAGLYGQRLMQHLKSFDTVQVVDSAEVICDTFPMQGSAIAASAGVLAISQSGETKDVIEALKIADSFGIARFSVVNAVGSFIARLTGCGVYCYAGRENAVASTKAFTSQVTVLALIAAWFAQLENRSVAKHRCKELISALHKLHTYVGAVLFGAKRQCKVIAEFICENEVEHMFVLGKGFAESIAYEGALKIKEITYIHAEGYSGGALKHGPFALIDEKVPVIMIILDDEHSKVMVTNAHEIEARNGQMIYITDNKQLLFGLSQQERIIEIPKNGPLTALLAVVPLQMIAYYVAIAKGLNPDKPRNLAKAVTVV
jgi:glucosamine--fructose-6-phosphate aminotransferase (isomerizing)